MLEELEISEDNIMNEDMTNFKELGLIRDSNALHNSELNTSEVKKTDTDKTGATISVKFTNRLSENFTNEFLNEELDENNDAKPEEIAAHSPFNNTLDDIWTLHMFGKRDQNEKQISFESKKAKFFDRLLHPIQYGSLRGSIFALSSLCLEATSMVLGIRCKQFGLVNFIIILILGGILAYWCLVMIIKAGKTSKEKSFSKVVKSILGKKVGIFMDIIITIDLFGELISFQVIIYQMLGSIVYDIMKIAGTLDEKEYKSFIIYKENYWHKKAYLKFPIMFSLAILVFPLCLLKDITKIRIPSLIGVLALVYAIIVVIIESFFYIINENKDQAGDMNWIDITKAFNVKDRIPFFGGLATVFYLYSCHAGAFPVYKTLRNNTTRRIKKVFFRSILLDILVYVFIATASFITSPFESPELILYRPNLKTIEPDYFILVAKIGVIFNTFFSTPANYEVFRLSFCELVWGNSNITKIKNVVLTGIFLAIVSTIGAVYDDILEYFELIGGFCTVIYCILIPGLIYAINEKIKKSKLEKYLVIFIVVSMTIIGYSSGIMTIIFKII